MVTTLKPWNHKQNVVQVCNLCYEHSRKNIPLNWKYSSCSFFSIIFLTGRTSWWAPRYCCLPSLCPWNEVFCNLSVSFTVQEFSSYGIIIIICPDTPQITAWVGIIIWWAYNVKKSIFSSGIFLLQECRNNPLFIRKVFSITPAR